MHTKKTNKDIKLTWEQLRELFMTWNKIPGQDGHPGLKEPLHAVAVFSSENWPDDKYSLESRSYRFTSDNKVFKDNYGCSCYAGSLDGSDPWVDIMKYDWKIDYCYLL